MKKRLSIVIALILVVVAVFGIVRAKNAAPVFEGRLSVTEYGINVIKEQEGFSPTATEKDGETVIGYGCSLEQAKTYGFPTDKLSQEEAHDLLLFVIRGIEKDLKKLTSTESISLKRHQFDALVSFSFDQGTQWMHTDSPLKTVLCRNGYTAADFSIAMSQYCQPENGTISDEQVSRRIRDAALFLYGNYHDTHAQANFSVLRFLSHDGELEAITIYPVGIPYQNLRAANGADTLLTRFVGWYTADGEKITSNTISSHDITQVQARWALNNKTFELPLAVEQEESVEGDATAAPIEDPNDPQLTHKGDAYKSSSNLAPIERQYSINRVVFKALNKGFVLTLKLFAVTLLGALPLGLLISFGSMSKFAPLKYVTKTIVWIFRGSPLLLQLMIVFYIPGYLLDKNIWAFDGGRFWAAAAAFILNYACYFSEIFRGGIESVPVGQTEAGLVLGMTKTQIFFKVKLMQLVKRILPPMSNEIITLVKDTSLANTIGILEVIYQGKSFMKSDGLIWPLFFTGVYYLAFTGILTLFLGWLERKLNYFRV